VQQQRRVPARHADRILRVDAQGLRRTARPSAGPKKT